MNRFGFDKVSNIVDAVLITLGLMVCLLSIHEFIVGGFTLTLEIHFGAGFGISFITIGLLGDRINDWIDL